MSLEKRLRALIADGHDAAPVRVSLAQACLGRGDAADALEHLDKAVALDPDYTVAWKILGRALHQDGRDEEAGRAWRRGLELARAHGDRQAEREMQVFLKRLERR